MLTIGEYNTLKVLRKAPAGLYLDDGDKGLLLPNRFVPPDAAEGSLLRVFVYHDGEDRPIATTQQPKGVLGDIVLLKVVSVTPQGAFMDWGLMKDLFVPRSQQIGPMRPQGEYLVKIYKDELTGRLAATQKIDSFLSNETLTIAVKDVVQLIAYRTSDIGHVMIINQKHTGMLHFNEVYRNIKPGDTFEGYIKKIYPDHKIDVVAGRPGPDRVEDERQKILRLLQEHGGYLPYHDKSDPEDIYSFFGMSKKTFKMAIGNLYKEKKISLEKTGIKILDV